MKKLVVGILCSLGISFLLMLMSLGFLFYSFSKPKEIKVLPHTVLELKLGPVLQEEPTSWNIFMQKSAITSLRDVIDGLQKAARDPHIKGVVVHMEKLAFSGIAQIQELRNALHRFRKEGKFALVYNDTFGEMSSGMGAYYFATAFDEIWMQPLGSLNITGLSITQPFGRKLLERLGFFPDIETREEYKTAYDFAKEAGLTPAHRQELQEMLESLFNGMVKEIAQGRELSEAEVREAIRQAPIFQGEKAVKEGLVDKLAYKDEIYAYLKKKKGILHFINFHKYAVSGKGKESFSPDAPQIAVIFAHGVILREAHKQSPLLWGAGMNMKEVLRSLTHVIEDPAIKAIVFRIDSPGGSPLASDMIWHALKKVRQARKPLIVSMGNTAASGGYWAAMPADKIIANPGTLTGSIGVILGKMASQEFWENIGVHWEGVQTSPQASLWEMIHPYTPEEKKWITGMIDHVYDVFLQKVCEGRRLSLEHVRQVAKGRVWTGEQALRWGLVDGLGDLTSAIEVAKSEARLTGEAREKVHVVYFPKSPSVFKQLAFLLEGKPLLGSVAFKSLFPEAFHRVQEMFLLQGKGVWAASSAKVGS